MNHFFFIILIKKNTQKCVLDTVTLSVNKKYFMRLNTDRGEAPLALYLMTVFKMTDTKKRWKKEEVMKKIK